MISFFVFQRTNGTCCLSVGQTAHGSNKALALTFAICRERLNREQADKEQLEGASCLSGGVIAPPVCEFTSRAGD